MQKNKKQVRTCPFPLQKIHSHYQPFLKQSSPFLENNVEGLYDDYYQMLPDYQILVVGAGGLGCEIVKNLAVSGIRNIDLIDMDTIDLTNLNRQFLFRKKDIGQYKAEVVANFVMERCPGIKITPHTSRVQQMGCNFYSKFNIIIGGLDNVQARKFLNDMVFQLNSEQQQIVCYYIDGATEGFQGQSLLVYPFVSSCYSCSLLDGLQNKTKANYCTIANTPRTPEHCIQYILQIQWQKQYPETKRDNDNMEHMKWIYEKSLERAKQFNIQGVTQMLTMGVAKNIIPAIASTNALIAAFCTNQAMKLITDANPHVKNYYIYKGGSSVGSDTYQIAKKQDCTACLMREKKLKDAEITMPKHAYFSEILQKITEINALVQNPFVNVKGKIIYNPSDSQRRQKRKAQTIDQLLKQNVFNENPQTIIVSNNNLRGQQKIIIHITEK